MNIVIDSAITQGLVNALANYDLLLKQARKDAEDFRKQADEDRMMTIEQACAYLGGISQDTLLYYRRVGLDYYKKGREAVWYRKGDIDAWLAAGKVNRHKR